MPLTRYGPIFISDWINLLNETEKTTTIAIAMISFICMNIALARESTVCALYFIFSLQSNCSTKLTMHRNVCVSSCIISHRFSYERQFFFRYVLSLYLSVYWNMVLINAIKMDAWLPVAAQPATHIRTHATHIHLHLTLDHNICYEN